MILFGSAKTLKSEKKQNFKKSMKTGEVITAIQDARKFTAMQYRKQYGRGGESEYENENEDNWEDTENDEEPIRYCSKKYSVVRLIFVFRKITMVLEKRNSVPLAPCQTIS